MGQPSSSRNSPSVSLLNLPSQLSSPSSSSSSSSSSSDVLHSSSPSKLSSQLSYSSPRGSSNSSPSSSSSSPSSNSSPSSSSSSPSSSSNSNSSSSSHLPRSLHTSGLGSLKSRRQSGCRTAWPTLAQVAAENQIFWLTPRIPLPLVWAGPSWPLLCWEDPTSQPSRLPFHRNLYSLKI